MLDNAVIALLVCSLLLAVLHIWEVRTDARFWRRMYREARTSRDNLNDTLNRLYESYLSLYRSFEWVADDHKRANATYIQFYDRCLAMLGEKGEEVDA